MKIHNFNQGSKEWFEIRADKMTASHANTIKTNGKGLQTYVYKKMFKFITEQYKTEDEFLSYDIERGKELESIAISDYELETGKKVKTVGFVEFDDHVGCSPDGLVGNEGLLEIKCPRDWKFLKFLVDGEIESQYIYQMQMQMLVTGREWCDFLVFNESFKVPSAIKRVERDDEKIEKIRQGLDEGERLIKKILSMRDKIWTKKEH